MSSLLDLPVSRPPMPSNWDAGFRNGDHVIAAGGTERPFFHDGAWRLCVFEKSTGKHLVYNYSTDVFEADAVRDQA